jgi:hypothetical protein
LLIALKEFNEKYTCDVEQNEMLQRFKSELERDLLLHSEPVELTGQVRQQILRFSDVSSNILKNLRKELTRMRRENLFDDEMLRKRKMQMDLDEAGIYHKLH